LETSQLASTCRRPRHVDENPQSPLELLLGVDISIVSCDLERISQSRRLSTTSRWNPATFKKEYRRQQLSLRPVTVPRLHDKLLALHGQLQVAEFRDANRLIGDKSEVILAAQFLLDDSIDLIDG
jgi:hypothetical protein